MVTMDPIDVDYHNQLIGHLPAGSRSGGLSHERSQPSSLPNTMVADCLYGGALFKSNSGFFLLPACLFGGRKRDRSQLCCSATRAPHLQFLLENRDKKSSGS